MSALEKCIAIVEAWAQLREAEEDAQRFYRMPLISIAEQRTAAHKAHQDRVAADRLLRSLPLPTPEELAELREGGK